MNEETRKEMIKILHEAMGDEFPETKLQTLMLGFFEMILTRLDRIEKQGNHLEEHLPETTEEMER